MDIRTLEANINGATVRVPAGTKIGQRWVRDNPEQGSSSSGHYEDLFLEADAFVEVSIRGSLWYMVTGALNSTGGVKVGGPLKFKRVGKKGERKAVARGGRS